MSFHCRWLSGLGHVNTVCQLTAQIWGLADSVIEAHLESLEVFTSRCRVFASGGNASYFQYLVLNDITDSDNSNFQSPPCSGHYKQLEIIATLE